MKGFNFQKLVRKQDGFRPRRSLNALLMSTLLLGAAACDEVENPSAPEPGGDVTQVAAANPQLTTLVGALVDAGLVDALKADGPFTVFAPLNSAFAALDSDVLAGITGNTDLLAEVLTFHVVAGVAARSTDLTDGQTVTTLEGGDLTIGVSGSSVTVNGANVVTADIDADNGVIHLIDGVLVPQVDVVETAIVTPATQTLAAAVAAGDLVATLQGAGPFTVFAPVDDAFDALGSYTLDALLDPANQAILQEILTYHVIADEVRAGDLSDGLTATTVEGRDLTFDLSDAQDPKVNGVSIIATDVVADNGVIHLVDEVIVPELDIVETAIITEGTGTLAAAVAAGGLAATLQETGPFTVFAPVDAAFDALGEYTVDALLDPANQAILADVLTYHVIADDVRAGELSDGLSVATVEGGNVTFDLSDPEDPQVNGVSIIGTDIVVENGVIHLIDGVLTQSLDVVERAIVTEETSTLVDAVVAGDLVATLQGDGPFTVFAPLNSAFAELGTDQLNVLLDPANIGLLQKILTYHVIADDVRAGELSDGLSVATVEGTNVTFDLSDPEDPKVNGASIVATDIVVENGVIHLIDGVLTENADLVDVALLNGFPTLVDLAVTAGLEATLRSDNGGAGWTVFAPTEAAFAALTSVPTGQDLIDVLTYHVVSGTVGSGALSDGQVVTTVEGSTFTINIDGSDVSITDGTGNTVNVVLTDVPASNGVVHVIDGVILPS